MTAALATPISQIELTPGSAIRIGGVTWESYVALLQELGDDRPTRVAYDHGRPCIAMEKKWSLRLKSVLLRDFSNRLDLTRNT